MPELPEVETIRRLLIKDIVEKTIKEIEVLSAKQFIGDKKKIIGQKITNIERVGKIMAVSLSNKLYLNIHLKMAGQLLFSKNRNTVFHHKIPFVKGDTLPAKTTRIIIDFSDGSLLFFNDLRKFGWMKVSDKPEKPTGTDVLSSNFTLQRLINFTASTKKPIKLLLMDQDKIAGIGNIYANEILFYAAINPTRKANSLKEYEINKLHKAISNIINAGLKYHGSSAGDEAYVLPDASRGHYQEHMAVYQREGESCLNKCGTIIQRIKQSGRSSFFCPKCQK